MHRFLITTADERTWRFDEPVLFLGEWCRCYDKKTVWEVIPHAKVSRPYGMANAQKDEDSATACRMVDELMPIITRELNTLHGTRYSERYWRIVLSIWLHRCVCVILNRYKTLEQALTNYKISSTSVFDASSYQLATANSINFIGACNDDVWNNILCAEILKCIPGQKIPMEIIAYNEKDHWFYFGEKTNIRTEGFKKTIIERLFNLYKTFAINLVKDDDAFLISTYAGTKTDVKLNLMLGQIPVFWKSPIQETVHPNPTLRTDLALKLVGSEPTGLEACVMRLIFKLMPTCFLEGYTKLVSAVEELPWPKKPRFIFTSNNFDIDEVFKVWAGEKAESGIPYYIGQHGGAYGSFRYPISERYLLQTSDKFITWGWRSSLPTVIPGFIWSDIHVNRDKNGIRSSLLLVGRSVLHRIYTWDNFCEMRDHQDAQFRLIEHLSALPRSSVLIRAYVHANQWRWCDQARWIDRFPGIKFDEHQSFVDSVRKARLVVFFFDSTGLLQTLQANHPVIGSWPSPLDWLRDDAKEYYDELMRAGILHDKPSSAAKLINEVWGDIDGWWHSSTVQKARATFCDNYAVTKRKKVSSLLSALGV